MILASLTELAAHPSAPASVREAARLLEAALRSGPLPEGKTKLGTFDLIVSSAPEKPAAEQAYEAHRANIDLQVPLSGPEHYRCAALPDCVMQTLYDPSSDAALYAPLAAAEHCLVLAPLSSVVFFPGDAHKARIQAGSEPAQIRKAVVKIPSAKPL